MMTTSPNLHPKSWSHAAGDFPLHESFRQPEVIHASDLTLISSHV
jgi:hypothetical protein